MPQYASPRPLIISPSPSAAATNMHGPSKLAAISVSGVSGPKLPRNTTSALQPFAFTSATAASMSFSFSTVTGHSYSSPGYACTIAARRRSDNAMGKQSRLTATMPSRTFGRF